MSNVYMDPVELRRIASMILGNREFDYRPQLDEIHRDIQPGQASISDVMEGRPEGYVYGRSGIGSYHDDCIDKVIEMFENIDLGLIALSNLFAVVAEDYTKTDGEAGADLAATMEYFTGGTAPR